MVRLLPASAFAAVLVVGAAAPAQDEKKEKAAGPTGVWTREVGGVEMKIDFTAGKGTFKASMAKGDDGIATVCTYTAKDGVVKAEITKVEEKGNFPNAPPVGFAFSFKWAPKADTAELSDLTGNFAEEGKALIEGEWTRVKGKK